MDTLTYTPHKATQVAIKPRVLRAQFGDGYVQEVADGINAMLPEWDLTWQNLHAATGGTPTAADLNTFFKTQEGYKKFLWTPPAPLNVQGTFVCVEWNWVYDAGNMITGLRAHLIQRPS
jgi:phage-related protein